MREVHACHVIHSLQAGGAEHVLVTLAQVASSAEIRMSVICLMPTTGAAYAARLRQLDVPVHSLDLRTRWDPRAIVRTSRLLRALRPDIVHTHLKHADLAGTLAGRLVHVPTVSTLHVIEDAPTPVRRLKRRLAAIARIHLASRTLTVSDAQRRWYLATFKADPRRVTTVYNGVLPAAPPSAARRAEVRRQLGVAPSAVMVLQLGIMRPGKGHDDLFAAVERLPGDLDIQFVLAGDGPLRGALQARVASSARLRRLVSFAGFRDDVEDVLAAADIVVQPSHFDALPTSLIYAAAMGRPAVACAVGGIPEIVTRRSGILVPAKDAAALAQALEWLARDPAARAEMGAAAAHAFRQRFDAAAWARALRELYVATATAGPLHQQGPAGRSTSVSS